MTSDSLAEAKAGLKARDSEARQLLNRVHPGKRRIGRLTAKLTAQDRALRALRRSTSWRITRPLRAASYAVQWFLRNLRRALILLWWLATGQFSRAAKTCRHFVSRFRSKSHPQEPLTRSHQKELAHQDKEREEEERVLVAARKAALKEKERAREEERKAAPEEKERAREEERKAALEETERTREEERKAAPEEKERARKEKTLKDRAAGFYDAQQWSLAASHYDQLTRSNPSLFGAWLNLGRAYLNMELVDQAFDALTAALRLRPDDVRARKSFTAVLVKKEDDPRVLEYLLKRAKDTPHDVQNYRWLTTYYSKLHDWDRALENALSGLDLDPHDVELRIRATRILMHLDNLPEALNNINLVLKRSPRNPSALQLKGDIYVRLSQFNGAIELYRRALSFLPNHPLTSYRLSGALFLIGDVMSSFRYHEHRKYTSTFIDNNKPYRQPQWQGDLDVRGKVLVWAESGFGVGQNILHSAFLRQLTQLRLDVVVEIEDRLLSLYRRSFPAIEFLSSERDVARHLPDVVYQTPIGSLARWFRPSLESFGDSEPYLRPDSDRVYESRGRLLNGAERSEILVGISWTSTNPFVGNQKSIELSDLLRTLDIPGVRLVNLQYGDHAEAIASALQETGAALLDSGVDNTNDLDGLAAVIAAMDLVVCIGHTTAHLAGAIGTPNYVLLPASPFAHWLASGTRCPWYPHTRVFRQSPIDPDWDNILVEAREAVIEFQDHYNKDDWLEHTLVRARAEALTSSSNASEISQLRSMVSGFMAHGAYRSALALHDKLVQMSPDERELSIVRADIYARSGFFDLAESGYLTLLDDCGDDETLLKKLLDTQLSNYKLEFALSTAHRLIALSPNDAEYRLTVASIHYRLGEIDLALKHVRTASFIDPELSDTTTLLAVLLLEKGEPLNAAQALLRSVHLESRADDLVLLARASAAQGLAQDAIQILDRARQLAPLNPAVNFWFTQEQLTQTASDHPRLPGMIGELPRAGVKDRVFFFAADNSYFWQHGLKLITSIVRNCVGSKCHVHVINPDPNVEKAISRFSLLAEGVDITYTHEVIDFAGCSSDHVTAYYASVRFVRLAEIMGAVPAHYICLDCDCIVRRDLTQLSADLRDFDLLIRMRFDHRPHFGVVASTIILAPSAAALAFMTAVAKFIQSTLESRQAVWFLDQVVLSHVMRAIPKGDLRMGQLEMSYIDWYFHDDSYIWNGKGSRKTDDYIYTKGVGGYETLLEDDVLRDLAKQFASSRSSLPS